MSDRGESTSSNGTKRKLDAVVTNVRVTGASSNHSSSSSSSGKNNKNKNRPRRQSGRRQNDAVPIAAAETESCKPRLSLQSNPGVTGTARGIDRNGNPDISLENEPTTATAVLREPRVLEPLSEAEQAQLETALEFDETDQWRDDWSGNLAYADKEIANPFVTRNSSNNNSRSLVSNTSSTASQQSFQQPLLLWAQNIPAARTLLANLLRHVYNLPETPTAAKRLLGMADPRQVPSMLSAIRRTCYDSTVLQQDGWTTVQSAAPVGATGGPFLIGDRVRWEGSDATVIAHVHDAEIGDLWKAVWMEDQDNNNNADENYYEAFDLEAEELLEAKRKWERRQKSTNTSSTGGASGSDSRRSSARTTVDSEFTVKGVQNGIVLATSYSKGARPGVYWPARVLHASEATHVSQGKRSTSTSKQKVELVFLAPYWDASELPARSRRVNSLSESGQSVFSSGPLLQWEAVEATDDIIKEYPYDGKAGLDIPQLRMAFRFTGLPKAAFPRFLDSNRLAISLKTFAKRQLKTQTTATDRASAGLFETHPMAVQAPVFPLVVLHLPFSFILSELPHPDDQHQGSAASSDDGNGSFEPVIQLESIVEAMKPPSCWGMGNAGHAVPDTPPATSSSSHYQQLPPTPGVWLSSCKEENGKFPPLELTHFVNDLLPLTEVFSLLSSSPPIAALLTSAIRLLSQVSELKLELTDIVSRVRQEKLASLVSSWVLVKRHGEEAISAVVEAKSRALVVADWRRASERIYKYLTASISDENFGNGFSTVLTERSCNWHRTAVGCFERPVRLPAALKGARLAGAGTSATTRLTRDIDTHYFEYVEERLLNKVHSTSYLKRMKSRCAAAGSDSDGVVLTDDSDGNGGEDTRGSSGTWTAALAAVATAVKGVDMVVKGECVNAFCVTRPPGHHAGRSLHAMKAVSNGFCVLNTVACAAIYATTPILEGGLGLGRVCIIDFDVHHGNGTQDILCSTYDPRFLYVSIHAGGPEVNGVSMEDDPDHELHDLGSNPKQSGIYPGRCGDVSPHEGVLNIPLGAKVMPHAVGSAVISLINPKVDAFAPDLIILSAGFDAHKADPMGLGGLSAADFGHITEVACELAFKSCSGRVLSVLEGGYGIPCCRPQKDLFLPSKPEQNANGTANGPQELVPIGVSMVIPSSQGAEAPSSPQPPSQRPQPSKLLDLGDLLPSDMDDQVPYGLQRRLEKCHAEGFVDCVREHVKSLAKCNKRR